MLVMNVPEKIQAVISKTSFRNIGQKKARRFNVSINLLCLLVSLQNVTHSSLELKITIENPERHTQSETITQASGDNMKKEGS